jgi:hypothetical protein
MLYSRSAEDCVGDGGEGSSDMNVALLGGDGFRVCLASWCCVWG